MDNFPRGLFYGTTHTCLGQEADAVGVITQVENDDIIFSSHRGHGHFLAYGGDPRALFAELMGRATGVCGGRGGSQHLHWRNFYSNGIQGGIVPIATGMALAEKYKHTGAIAVAFLGDGTLGEGVVYEAFNMASLWNAPILYVLENNCIAQTTESRLSIAGDICGRFNAFAIPSYPLASSDVLEISQAAGELLTQVRTQQHPAALVIETYRFGPHSKGDDTRDPSLLQQIRQDHDPLKIHGARIEPSARQDIEASVASEIQAAFDQAAADPFPQGIDGP